MLDDDGEGRDARGRWKKGYCPNLKGRPRKEPDISDADVGWFKQRMVEATINGEKRWLTRHELLLHSMYEQAIKGKSVTITRKLFDRFENVDDTWAQASDWLREKAMPSSTPTTTTTSSTTSSLTRSSNFKRC